jgi:hypothetical protein
MRLLTPTFTLDHNWDRLNSFPSDTATLYFSLAAIIFLEWPLWGSVAMLWSALTVGAVRVALGYHFPSDILGGVVLGSGCVCLLEQNRIVRLFDRLILSYIPEGSRHIWDSLFFLFLADAYNLFAGLQGLKGVISALIKN